MRKWNLKSVMKEEIVINGIKTSENYNGPREHKLICTKLLD